MKSTFILILLCVANIRAQQFAAPSYDATVAHPAYATTHPVVEIDEAHHNIHKKDGLFKPFGDLLTNDGYKVVANTSTLSRDNLQNVNVLVISNPLGRLSNNDTNSSPAFTKAECEAVFKWVERGGSLFLIADHAPIGDAAQPLAQRFGVALGNNFVFDTNSANFEAQDITELVFSDENHLLGDHPITRGRTSAERLHKLVAFTGESLTIPRGATALLRLSPTAGQVSTGDGLRPLFDKDSGRAKTNREAGLRKSSAFGKAMAIAFTIGRGRVVISGEAGMMTAQEFEQKDNNGREGIGRMGWNVPGNDDRQYVLNVLHWLSNLLP